MALKRKIRDKTAGKLRKSKSRKDITTIHATCFGIRPSRAILVSCLLLIALTAAVYSPVTHYPFINYDDPDYVSQNKHIQGGLSWQTVTWAMTATDAANWHPLTWLSHAMDYQLYGLDPGGHHLSSVLIHVCNVVILFLLLVRATGEIGRSALVAALFAVHPFNVESVAWIAERKNVLSALFFFLALAAYGWYVRRPSWTRYSVLALAFVMGLASKAMVITLPCVLLLLDYWPLCRIKEWTTPAQAFLVAQSPWPHLFREKLPLFLLSAGSAVITIIAQKAGNALQPLGDLPFLARLENAIYSYGMYVAKIFWPVNFSPMYPHPLDKLTFAQIACATMFLMTVSMFVWNQRIRRPYALTGWLWFLGTLAPVIGIVQVGAQGMADRYAYLPTIGVFLILVWSCAEWLTSTLLGSRLAVSAGIAVLVALSLLTSRQIGYWRSSYDLWAHTLQITDDNFIADDCMGNLLLDQGRPEAIRYFAAAAKIAPWDPVSHGAVAANLQDSGKLQEAIAEYNIALRARPGPKFQAHVYADLGVIYRQLGDPTRARDYSQRALSIDSEEVYGTIAQLYQMVARHPTAPGFWRLGLLLEGANRNAEADSAYEQALRLDPGFNPARKALAGCGKIDS